MNCTAIRLPDDAPVGKNFPNHALQRTLQSFDTVARLELGGISQRRYSPSHGFTVEHTRDIMRGERRRFPTASAWEFGKKRIGECACDFRERISVEKKKRRFAVEGPQPV